MESLLLVLPVLIIIALVVWIARGLQGGNNILPLVTGVTVGIILVGAVLVPAIAETEEEGHNGWQYDDYRVCSNDCTASGSLEIVNLGGTTYLHAKDIGTGEYSEHGKTYEVMVEKANMDVFMLGGQSNAAYAYYDASAADPRPLPGTAYYYGTSTTPAQSWHTTTEDYGIYSMVDSSGDMYVGNVESPFAATYYEKTGHKVLIINTAISGTGINAFIPGQSGYDHMVEYWTDAMGKIDSDHFEVSVMSYLWIQGESDSSLPVNAYCGAFVKMNDALTDPDGVFKLKSAIISQVRKASSENAAEAQSYLASVWSNIFMGTEIAQTFTEANGLLRDDDLHYTQAGYNKIGVALADFSASHR